MVAFLSHILEISKLKINLVLHIDVYERKCSRQG